MFALIWCLSKRRGREMRTLGSLFGYLLFVYISSSSIIIWIIINPTLQTFLSLNNVVMLLLGGIGYWIFTKYENKRIWPAYSLILVSTLCLLTTALTKQVGINMEAAFFASSIAALNTLGLQIMFKLLD